MPQNHERRLNLNDAAISRAEEVVGQSFHRNPFALRDPRFYGEGIIGRNGITHNTVYLTGQGPLPVEINKGHLDTVRMVSLKPKGLPPLLVMTSPSWDNSNPDRRLGVVIEDNAGHIIQTDNNPTWPRSHDLLVSHFNTGGGVLLFPGYYRYLVPKQTIEKTSASVSALLGIKPNHIDYDCELNGALPPRHPDWLGEIILPQYLGNLRILFAEKKLVRGKEFYHLAFLDTEEKGSLHHAWICGPVRGEVIKSRVHSACSSSEFFNAKNCDCPPELDISLHYLSQEGGVLIYLDQEARGHGVSAKVQTWPLNIGDGIDLVTAFNAAGYTEDVRKMGAAISIFKVLGVKGVILMSNNISHKINAINDGGIPVAGIVSLNIEPQTSYCSHDLKAKQLLMGHIITGQPLNPNNDPRFMRRYH